MTMPNHVLPEPPPEEGPRAWVLWHVQSCDRRAAFADWARQQVPADCSPAHWSLVDTDARAERDRWLAVLYALDA